MHLLSFDESRGFWEKLKAEGIPLVATRTRDSAYKRISSPAADSDFCRRVASGSCAAVVMITVTLKTFEKRMVCP